MRQQSQLRPRLRPPPLEPHLPQTQAQRLQRCDQCSVAQSPGFLRQPAPSFLGAELADYDEAQFAGLSSVGGKLSLVETEGLMDFTSFGNPAGLTVAELELNANVDLEDVATASSVSVQTGGDITITNHSLVTNCDAQAFVDAQSAAGWVGNATVSGNLSWP